MKLIVIDPHVTRKSPSMRAWVYAFPVIRTLFEEVEIWASECDLEEENGVCWYPVPQRLPTWRLHAEDFRRRVRKRLARESRCESILVQATGCVVPQADIRYIQYWSEALLEEAAKRPGALPIGFTRKVGVKHAARIERGVTREPGSTGWWWVVSRSLAARIEAGGAGGRFRVIPNEYDPARFHQGVRSEWRDRMRHHYGLGSDEKILVFSAFGHFERKGLRQAVEAVDRLRAEGRTVRLLVLGGTPATIDGFRKTLTPGEDAACVFAGLVENMERHLSAADGFLFPSHFEAFSLAEIEAAALGLRLYLTPHYGSEMILREPENGRWLPWESAGMAAVIAEEIDEQRLGTFHAELGEALDPERYAARLRELYEEVIAWKRST